MMHAVNHSAYISIDALLANISPGGADCVYKLFIIKMIKVLNFSPLEFSIGDKSGLPDLLVETRTSPSKYRTER
jgi:hypothetical protein